MSGSWSKADSDWLISHYEELLTAHKDFIALVHKSLLVLEDANQALISLTTRLVCLVDPYCDARTSLTCTFLAQSFSKDWP